VNPDGTIKYTPAPGFVGTDSLTYKVCDTSVPPICTTAKVYYTVNPATAAPATSAGDDYGTTTGTTPATGNVLLNDKNSGGLPLTVTGNSVPPASQGTIVINPDGSYVFTPAPGFSGPVDVTYTACTSGTPPVCATATLHILVNPAPVVTPDFNETNINVPVSGNASTNDKVPAGSTYGTPIPAATNPAGGSITMKPDGTYTFTSTTPGTYTYYVPVCAAGQTSACPVVPLVITVKDPLSNTNPPIANPDIVIAMPGSTTTTNVLANDKASNAGGSLVPSTVAITVAPTRGTATVNADGTINYTPAPGFVGTDSLTYRVCDNSTPALCTTAKVYFTVPAANAKPITAASDDYGSTNAGSPTTGSVLANDRNSAGSPLTVTGNGTIPATTGTIVIKSDGTYTFTPAPGFTGAIDIPYTVCTSTLPPACAQATLHILVSPAPPAAPTPIGGTYIALAPGNPANIAGSVTNLPAGTKAQYCDVNGLGCSTVAPALPTKPGIYVWCVKSLDTLTGLTSTPCKYDTIRILPPAPIPANGTYIVGGSKNPSNIGGLVSGVIAGSKPQWCDVNGLNCSMVAPALPTVPGVYVWCVKAVDTLSGLTSTPCKYDTVTIVPVTAAMAITKVATKPVLNSDGTFTLEYSIAASNLRGETLDSVQVADNLRNVFFSPMTFNVLSLTVGSKFTSNSLFDGNTQTNTLGVPSKLGANQTDTIKILVKVSPNGYSGPVNNTASMSAISPLSGLIGAVLSNDPTNTSGSGNSKPTLSIIPKLDIFIPTGFSPNKDGVNDKFVIIHPYNTSINFQVYNRWGNIVYTNPNYNNEWDGKGVGNFLGQDVPDGTYYYVVKAMDNTGGQVQNFVGFLTLKR